VPDAAELITITANRFPDAVRLARVVSLASRIEPELLRQARLQLLPAVDAGAEADLWFSQLVQSSTPVALTLVPAVADLLRHELADSPDSLQRAWELIEEVHREAPAAIRLEERVTWETLAGGAGSLERVENELMSVVSAITVQKRSGLARWALRAVPRLPEAARKTKAATTLLLTAAAHLNAWHLLEKQIENKTLSAGFINELQVLLPQDLPRVTVGVRLLEDTSEFSLRSVGFDDSGGFVYPASSPAERRYLIEFSYPAQSDVSDVIEVPGTAPLMIEVSWGESSTRRIRNLSLYEGRIETLGLGNSSTVTIRTAAGDIYTLSEDRDQNVGRAVDARVAALARIPSPPSVGFVDRHLTPEVDIVQKVMSDIVAAERRLIQIVGAGGVGKTTLAAEVARRVLDAFQHRVVWLSAAGRSDFGLHSILDGVATQLSRPDLRTLDARNKAQEVKALLNDKPAIIFVDDFEIIAAKEATRCFSFLKSCDCASIVVSRRVMSRLDPRHDIVLGEMLRDEAMEFLWRVIRLPPSKSLFEESAVGERVVSVCEGNPLAIQLLVAQIEFVQDATEALAAMLKEKGDPLIHAFDLSFDLPQLGEEGRVALLGLELFVPDASREALAAVAIPDGDLERLEEAVSQLTRLKLATNSADDNRLAVDGFIRDALEARLTQSGKGRELRGRFVDYFLGFVEQRTESTAANYDALEVEFENLLDAMDMAELSQRWDELVRMCIALTGFLDVRGYWDEALRRNAQAQKAARKSRQTAALPRLNEAAGEIYVRRRQFAKAESAFRSVLRYYAGKPVNNAVANATRRLGSIAVEQGDLRLAKSLYSEALAISRQLQQRAGIADNIHNLAIVAQEQGNLDEARRLYFESLELSGSLNDDRSKAISLHQLGVIAFESGNYDEAERFFRQSLVTKGKLQDRSGMADTLHQLGLLFQAQGKTQPAESALRDALGTFLQLRSPSAGEVQEDLNALNKTPKRRIAKPKAKTARKSRAPRRMKASSKKSARKARKKFRRASAKAFR